VPVLGSGLVAGRLDSGQGEYRRRGLRPRQREPVGHLRRDLGIGVALAAPVQAAVQVGAEVCGISDALPGERHQAVVLQAAGRGGGSAPAAEALCTGGVGLCLGGVRGVVLGHGEQDAGVGQRVQVRPAEHP
jgi:hypothetical protein